MPLSVESDGPPPPRLLFDFRLNLAKESRAHREWGALVILGACILIFGFWPSLVLDFINSVTPQYLSLVTEVAGQP